MLGCFGCSFTAGQELENPERDAWPAKLSILQKMPVENHGKPGRSNEYILRQVRKNIDRFEYFAIGLTTPDRREVSDHLTTYTIWPGMDLEYFREIPHIKPFAKFITAYPNKEQSREKYLEIVDLMQVYLRYHKKKFVMFQALPLGFELKQKLDFVRWPENSTQWYKAQLPGGHPAAISHQKIAFILNKHIKEQGWSE